MGAADLGGCHRCGAPVGPADSFCEACGLGLGGPVVGAGEPGLVGACRNCGSAQVGADGYCERCGQKAPSGRDHVELDLGTLAGVSDRGLRHHRNEDAMALSAAEFHGRLVAMAVVCDGVSTSDRPDEASLVAADLAVDVLARELRGGHDENAALRAAARAAGTAVSKLAGPLGNPPAATYLSAVVTSVAVTTCWLGDSRAYWLPADPGTDPHLLTSDDSVAQALVTAGLESPAEALASLHGHVITRWLGADADPGEPHLARFEPDGPGVLLLCTDGLWNDQPDAAAMAGLAMPRALTDLPGAAADLLAAALGAGGHDNITVVLAWFPPRRIEPVSTAAAARIADEPASQRSAP
jgi:serine/threonine protein phosphatase PrpC